MTLRVVYAGTPAFAVPPLAALCAGHRVVGVLTQPDRPAGRGRQLTASPVREFATGQGLPVLQPVALRGAASTPETLAQIAAWQPDVMVVVAYGLILPQSLLQLPRLGCLNIHASLLPRWRGAAPIQRALQAGDETTGVSIMQMDAGLDTGAVLAEQALRIEAVDTAGSLHDRLAAAGAALLLDVLQKLESGGAQAKPQPAEGITYAAKLAKSESCIEWHADAAQIDRQIRAFNPWPVAETALHGQPVKLLFSRVPQQLAGADTGAATPGTVLGLNDDALQVAAGRGVVELLQLQRAGRKPVSAREFLNAERRGADAAPLVFA
jgi:methionyl-tRNA formyltransferase